MAVVRGAMSVRLVAMDGVMTAPVATGGAMSVRAMATGATAKAGVREEAGADGAMTGPVVVTGAAKSGAVASADGAMTVSGSPYAGCRSRTR